MKNIIFWCTLLSLVSIKADSLERLNPRNIQLTAKWLRRSSDRLANIDNVEKDAEIYQTVLEQDSFKVRLLQLHANFIGFSSIPAMTINFLHNYHFSGYPYTLENEWQPYLVGGIWLTAYSSLVSCILYIVNRKINDYVAFNSEISDALEEIKQAHMLKQ